MTTGHAFVYEANRDHEVKRELIDDVGHHADQNSVGRILEVGELDVEWSEFDTPSNVSVVGWGRFKSHRVPVSGLHVLKVANIIGLGRFCPPVRRRILFLLSRELLAITSLLVTLHEHFKVELALVGRNRIPNKEARDMVSKSLA